MITHINIGYLYDILGYMIEGQYEKLQSEDYRAYVQHYLDVIHRQRSHEKRQKFEGHLRQVLKYLLNNPVIDYETIFLEGATHGMGSQERARRVLLIIWESFFDDADWRDSTFINSDFELVDEPFEG
jgi:hypothetical protein